MTEPHADNPEVEAGSNGDSAEAGSEADLLTHYDILRVRAPNPGPLTLSGTNTWVVGREPTWVVDPGPLLEEHLERLFAAIDARGGLGGVVLTHDHHDHCRSGRRAARALPGAAGGRTRGGRRAARR